jgi:hypothetical protein
MPENKSFGVVDPPYATVPVPVRATVDRLPLGVSIVDGEPPVGPRLLQSVALDFEREGWLRRGRDRLPRSPRL